MRGTSIFQIIAIVLGLAGIVQAGVLLDFEDLTPSPPGQYTYSQTGVNSFVTKGVTVTLDTFYWHPTGSTSSGPGARVDDTVFKSLPTMNYAGGTGNAMHTNNVNLVVVKVDPEDPNKWEHLVSFLWGEYGGNVNLEVNGTLFYDEDFTLLSSAYFPKASVSVQLIGPAPDGGGQLGKVTITGDIHTCKIGGQELWLDNVEGANVASQAMTSVPAISGWGLIAMAALLAAIGVLVIGRQRLRGTV
jgi:hypothetical protein